MRKLCLASATEETREWHVSRTGGNAAQQIRGSSGIRRPERWPANGRKREEKEHRTSSATIISIRKLVSMLDDGYSRKQLCAEEICCAIAVRK